MGIEGTSEGVTIIGEEDIGDEGGIAIASVFLSDEGRTRSGDPVSSTSFVCEWDNGHWA